MVKEKQTHFKTNKSGSKTDKIKNTKSNISKINYKNTNFMCQKHLRTLKVYVDLTVSNTE